MEQARQDAEIKKYMKMIAISNRWDQVILRGCLTGTFVAVGTTIGFALLLLILGQFVSTFKQVPLLDTILEQTRLDVLIEKQLNQISEEEQGESVNPTPSPTPAPPSPSESILEFKDESHGIAFSYPSNLSTSQTSDDLDQIASLSGEGALSALDVYQIKLDRPAGNSSQRFITLASGTRVIMYVFENGATIDTESFSLPVYFVDFVNQNQSFSFVGFGDPDSPKEGREVFKSIVETVKFN